MVACEDTLNGLSEKANLKADQNMLKEKVSYQSLLTTYDTKFCLFYIVIKNALRFVT